MTFLYRYLPELIVAGHVYLAQPPLFRIIAGKQTQWALTEAEKVRILHGLRKNVNPEITRFKGLGEMMPGTLYRTTMDPALRSLLQVTIREGEALETDRTISDLMGKDVSRRFSLIMGGVDEVQALDI